jgi:tetratricopeptide (TPR) repeat protein
VHKGIFIAGGFAAVAVIGLTVANNRSRAAKERDEKAAVEQQIARLSAKIDEQAAALAGAAAPGTRTAAGATGTAAGAAAGGGWGDPSYLQKARLSADVLSEGFKRVLTQDRAQAAEAVKIFQEGIDKVDPDNAQFYSGLGRAMLILGKNDDALVAFAAAERRDPALADAVSGQGWAHFNLKQFAAAKEKWEQAAKINPKSLDALSGLAWVYLGLGDRDKSLAVFNVLIFSGTDRADWKIGRTMAAAGNTDLKQIRVYFPVPDPAAYAAPPASSPASAPARPAQAGR